VTPDSYRANQACDPVTDNVTCRVLFEVEDSWTTISPSDIGLDCSQTGCPVGPGSTVTVSVEGQFRLLTPLLASVFGGQDLSLRSAATAQLEYLPPAPVGGAPAKPTAEFSASPRSGDGPLEVTFTDLSGPAISGWLWSFGDGGSSTEQNSTYRCETPGTYTVTLQVVNLAGQDSVAKTDYIDVSGVAPSPPPSCGPSPSPSPSCQYPPNIIRHEPEHGRPDAGPGRLLAGRLRRPDDGPEEQGPGPGPRPHPVHRTGLVNDEGEMVGWAYFHLTDIQGAPEKVIRGYFEIAVNASQLVIVNGGGTPTIDTGAFVIKLTDQLEIASRSRAKTSGRRFANEGIWRRTAATRSVSISARTIPTPSDARATTIPHGSTTMAWP
jgi:PKD repeat protein